MNSGSTTKNLVCAIVFVRVLGMLINHDMTIR